MCIVNSSGFYKVQNERSNKRSSKNMYRNAKEGYDVLKILKNIGNNVFVNRY